MVAYFEVYNRTTGNWLPARVIGKQAVEPMAPAEEGRIAHVADQRKLPVP
jgi:hypothetical protein